MLWRNDDQNQDRRIKNGRQFIIFDPTNFKGLEQAPSWYHYISIAGDVQNKSLLYEF